MLGDGFQNKKDQFEIYKNPVKLFIAGMFAGDFKKRVLSQKEGPWPFFAEELRWHLKETRAGTSCKEYVNVITRVANHSSRPGTRTKLQSPFPLGISGARAIRPSGKTKDEASLWHI